LFLDPKFMFYSCADHIRGDETLIEAQTNKANHLLKLIDPKPGERIVTSGTFLVDSESQLRPPTGSAAAPDPHAGHGGGNPGGKPGGNQ
jgi:hypothetical protein